MYLFLFMHVIRTMGIELEFFNNNTNMIQLMVRASFSDYLSEVFGCYMIALLIFARELGVFVLNDPRQTFKIFALTLTTNSLCEPLVATETKSNLI